LAQAGGSATARRQLARRLRELRDSASLTTEAATTRIGWSPGRLSRVENAQQRVQPDEVEDMLDVYGMTDADERAALTQLAKRARQRGWWQQAGTALPDQFRNFVGYEATASRAYCFDLTLVPGLLQTAAYTHAVMSGIEPHLEQSELERRLHSRIARQRVFDREEPLELWAVIDEGVLRRTIGGPTVMRGQLRHLLEMAARDNITIQVVPGSVGAYPGLTGWFTVLEFPDDERPDMAYTDGPGGCLYLEDSEDVRACTLGFGHLRGVALGAVDSVAMIRSVLEDLPERPD